MIKFSLSCSLLAKKTSAHEFPFPEVFLKCENLALALYITVPSLTLETPFICVMNKDLLINNILYEREYKIRNYAAELLSVLLLTQSNSALENSPSDQSELCITLSVV